MNTTMTPKELDRIYYSVTHKSRLIVFFENCISNIRNSWRSLVLKFSQTRLCPLFLRKKITKSYLGRVKAMAVPVSDKEILDILSSIR